MSILLHEPIQIPPKALKMQRIDSVHISYVDKMVAVTTGSYEETDSDIPVEVYTEAYPLDDLAKDENLVHFKFVFKAIFEKALLHGLIGEGVYTDD